jgi:tetratricopeptide (TPR) repeat protein
MQLADAMSPDRRVQMYDSIAAAQHDTGDAAGARTTLQGAVDLVRRRLPEFDAARNDPQSPGGRQRNGLLESLGRLQAKLGDRKQAIETIRRINDSTQETEALKELARDLASAGDLDGALEAVGQMNSPKSEAEALKVVASAFSRRETVPPAR